MSKTKKQRPIVAAFKQQRLPAWKPILTPRPTIIALFVIGILFVGLGVGFYFSYTGVQKTETLRYDNQCDLGEECTIELDIDDEMDDPIYLYYKLTNYHQNHRRYVTSRNDDQLRGEQIESFSELNPTCDPRTSLDDSKDRDDLFQPCGLIAYSFFNDSFRLFEKDSGDEIEIEDEDIAWTSDVEEKFGNPPEDTRGIFLVDSFTNRHFVNWMRVAAFPNFIKLWGVIEKPLKGKYELVVRNRYDVEDFDGKKEVFLSTTSTLTGGKNPFLGFAYMAVGAITIVFAIAYTVLLRKARKLGDTRYIQWQNEGY